MAAPLVSIITLSYNYERYIDEAVRSVLDQTYPHWELIIVDDASQDDSLEVIRRFDDPRIAVLPLTSHVGAAAAYNIAYEECRGKYLGTLDADDLFLPEKIERQVALLEARSDLDVLGTWITQIDGAGREIDGFNAATVNQPRDLNALELWIVVDVLCHSSALLRKSTHDRVGGLNGQLRLAPDYELWLRFLAQGARFDVIEEPLTAYRTHGSNVSQTYDQRELWIEFAFLFATHVVPILVRRRRQDLLALALKALMVPIGHAVGPDFAAFALRTLVQWPAGADFAGFRTRLLREIQSRHASAWARVGAPLPTPATSTIRKLPHAAGPPPAAISIVDDYFPNLVTGFRVAEFNYYLDHLDCVVYSRNPDFDRLWREYAVVYPHLASRVRRFDAERASDCALFYCVFLNNAYSLLSLAEARHIPLVFTLYPGGGFELFNPCSDLMLARLANSPRVSRIIVTQQVTRDYVLQGGFATESRLEMIWGLPAPLPAAAPVVRRHWPADKPALDLCFAAMKYMPGGADKGFDTFVSVARRLVALDDSFRFHVGGTFAESDADLGSLGDRITFHGPQPTHRLPQFFAGMDVIISPNVPFRLRPGGFDGFPTGTCIEAALSGVAVICTDPFSENKPGHFAPDEELCIVDADAGAIVDRIMALHAEPDRLHRLARRGQERCRQIYGVDGQLAPRHAVLAGCLSQSHADLTRIMPLIQPR